MSVSRYSAILLTLFFAIAFNDASAGEETPITIKVKNPDGLGSDGVLLSAGWALVLEFEVEDAIGVIDNGRRPDEVNMAWILRDPDDCIDMRDWISPGNPSLAIEGCSSAAPDETFVRFSPDFIDAVGITENFDSNGILEYQEALQDDAFDSSNLANLNRQYFSSGFTSSVPGAFVGATTESSDEPQDGYGYGVNDDFPGLYVWAEIGTGIVTDEFLNPVADPITGAYKLRNMAGLFNSISYTQLARNNKSSLVAVLNVERGVLEPIVQIDFKNVDVNSGAATGGGFLRRIDGGPIEDIAFSTAGDKFQNEAYEEVLASLENYEVIIKAAVVEGDALPFIQDLDGNGRYNKRDLEQAGHTLLSNLKRYRVRAIQIEALDSGFFECPNAQVFKEARLDNDTDNGVGCSTGSARSIVRRPR
ncbi:MAG: hypothetical protein KJO31_12855 [Gammaproteobacteria bacterium]|nr:hypothetical protein [Gammaproteobacteria bacterium]